MAKSKNSGGNQKVSFGKRKCGSPKKSFNKHLPHTTKDVQSLMNNACGFYCLALAHFINAFRERTGDIYKDVDDFIDLFDRINTRVSIKKNNLMNNKLKIIISLLEQRYGK